MMQAISEMTETISEKYISITDFTDLKIGDFLESIILIGMEKVYNKILSVPKKSEYSFVIFPSSNKKSNLLKKSLEDINEEGKKSNKYNYIFVSSMDEVSEFLKNLK
ncbi:hypothetical protein GF389_00970 [Candidatus Dojkabacteria bacterium]|nr:hypothetical protein [Candidatus Dojkabacteria bacterium]